MSAVRFPGHIEWGAGIIALSIVIGIVAATAGLTIFFRFEGLFARALTLFSFASLHLFHHFFGAVP